MSDPEWEEGVVTPQLGDLVKVTATPLVPIPDGEREKEIAKGNTVLLIGSLMAIIDGPSDVLSEDTDEIVNFMKVTSLQRAVGGEGRKQKLALLRGMTPHQRIILV
jgi:hypothetical protein